MDSRLKSAGRTEGGWVGIGRAGGGGLSPSPTVSTLTARDWVSPGTALCRACCSRLRV